MNEPTMASSLNLANTLAQLARARTILVPEDVGMGPTAARNLVDILAVESQARIAYALERAAECGLAHKDADGNVIGITIGPADVMRAIVDSCTPIDS